MKRLPGKLSAHGLSLQLRRGFDEIAGHLLQPGDDLGLAAGPAAQEQRDLLDAGVAVAREVIGVIGSV